MVEKGKIMKKRVLSIVLAFCLLLTVSATAFAADETQLPFADVAETDYFYAPVLWAVDWGITAGTSQTTFSPYETTTRAQIVTFLWRYAGKPSASIENIFTDVREGEYYYDALLWAVENGIAKGVSANEFAPYEPVTRAQAVTFLARMMGITDEMTGMKSQFKDVSKKAYYANAVAWAAGKGITRGVSETKFAPDETCVRAQIVTFIYRYDKNPNKYINDPIYNEYAMENLIEDPNAVYGFSPNPNCEAMKEYAEYDWSDPEVVAQLQEERLIFYNVFESVYEMALPFLEDGISLEMLAQLVAPSLKDEPEFAPIFEMYQQYGSWRRVILKYFGEVAAIDACVGIYDDCYPLYVSLGVID